VVVRRRPFEAIIERVVVASLPSAVDKYVDQRSKACPSTMLASMPSTTKAGIQHDVC